MIWICVAPVQPIASAAWNVDASLINLLTVVFNACYLPASILTTFVSEAYGLRTTLLLGAIAAAVGSIVRALGAACLTGPRAFYVVFTGQTIVAATQTCLVNLASRLASDWFPDAEIGSATIVATMSNVAGQLAGVLIPPLVVSDATTLAWLIVAQAPIAVGTALVLWAFIPDRPPTPPSESAAGLWRARDAVAAAARAADASRGFLYSFGMRVRRVFLKRSADMKVALSSRAFLSLTAGFALCTGLGWTLLSVQAQLLQPCGYSDILIGSSSGALLAVGALVSFGTGPLTRASSTTLARTQKVVVALATAAAVGVLVAVQPDVAPAVVVSWCVFGATIQPLLPLSFEIGAQLTYPADPDVSATLLCVATELVAMALTLAASPLLSMQISVTCGGVLSPFAVLAFGVMLLGTVVTLPLSIINRRPVFATAVLTGRAAQKLLRAVHARRSRTFSNPLRLVDNPASVDAGARRAVNVVDWRGSG